MSFQEPNALQIRVALAGIEPAIWRRLIVPRSFHLGQLHRVIQAAFGWWDSHLHEFRIGGLSYRDAEVCEPEFEDDTRSFDESEVRLLDFDRSEGLSFLYLYDFGDDWEHIVEFERLLALDPAPPAASTARPPGRPRMSAASTATPTSSTSSPTPTIPSTATPNAGPAAISTPSGSTVR